MSSAALIDTTALLPPTFPLVASGKVRDLYSSGLDTLLFIATDRISAYDVVLSNGIPGKGRVLTLLTTHWIELIRNHLPNVKTHFISLDLPGSLPSSSQPALHNRTMVVKKCRVVPLECIVRGYLTGSAYAEYCKSGTIHGMQLPAGLRESEAIPGGALFTPSTKAPPGESDVNISQDEARKLVGESLFSRIETMVVAIYKMATTYAEQRGIIIADTKFEVGLDDEDNLILIDEVLTPDSSRFWDRKKYVVGQAQDSYDKQSLRDWLVQAGLKGKEGVAIPEDVVISTAKRYEEAYERLVGKKLGGL